MSLVSGEVELEFGDKIMRSTVEYSANRIVILSVIFIVFVAVANGATFTVNTTGNGADANPGNGVCLTGANNCSLRAAIQEANATFGSDTIAFEIPGAGVHTLTPGTEYPRIEEAVVIDGWSQGGPGYTGPPLIELNGTNAGANATGLTVRVGDVTIRGLVINRFGNNGITIRENGVDAVRIRGCYIGTDPTGMTDRGNGGDGINLLSSSQNSVIGGMTVDRQNLISGNERNGIQSDGIGTQIIGNLIGTDITGTVTLANGISGIELNGGSNTVGGASPDERNVISGNSIHGIHALTSGLNQIKGNYIGTSVTGDFGIGNGVAGISVEDSPNNTIGGILPGEENTIAYNEVGILVGNGGLSNGVQIRGNSIQRNNSLGIDLIGTNGSGVTPNDPGDADGGSNQLQNYPVLAFATTSGMVTSIEGTLDSELNSTYSVDFYASPTCNSSSHGEGRNYIGTTTVPDPGGNFNFSFIPPNSVPLGQYVTATATRTVAPLNTSEFSECVQVSNNTSIIVTNTNNAGAGSLRQAIQNANSLPGIDTIRFEIPGGGVHTIAPISALPALTDEVIIDGRTQPGFVNMPLIEISGENAGSEVDGLTITGFGNTVRGLIINRFNGDGIELAPFSGNNMIMGNYIGTNAIGTTDLGNNLYGIHINGSENNRIGGANPLATNLISGNTAGGIRVVNSIEFGNRIVGNIIGTDITRTVALGNSLHGIEFSNAALNVVGGGSDNTGNLISGNVGNGIVFNNAHNNQVKNNLIGTDGTGTAGLANGGSGVHFSGGSSSNNIGGLAAMGNTIAFNNRGISVDTLATGNAFRGNSIFSNVRLGIDLAANDVTLNDVDDADVGANNLQNYPVLTTAYNTPAGTRVYGSLNSTADTSFTVEYFSNTSCDSFGSGEGKVPMGSKTVTTDANGDVDFSIGSDIQVPTASIVTATATRNEEPRDTSEFSQCRVVEDLSSLTFGSNSGTYTVGEGHGVRTVEVHRNGIGTGQITVNYATSDGTATAGVDYIATSGTFTFAEGETVKVFEVPVLLDSLDEPTETINLTLSSPSPNVPLAPHGTAVISLFDFDTRAIFINDVSLPEGNMGTTQFTFNIQLTNPSPDETITVEYSTFGLTAIAGQDYTDMSGVATFAPGQTTFAVSVPVMGDPVAEPTEVFDFLLFNPDGAPIYAPASQGQGYVIDDDSGWEADLAPRPTGSNTGTITVTDFSQVGRFAAGLDTDYQGNEFQRADCAPRAGLGNGVVTVADYTQAGRYAAGIDTPTFAGGQSAPALFSLENTKPKKKGERQNLVPTAIRIVNAQGDPNTQVTVSIETDAQGGENGFGFSVNYDPTKLNSPLVTLGSGVPGTAALIPNTLQAGRVGVILGLPWGTGLTQGNKQLVTIRFNVAPFIFGGLTDLTLGNAPVFQEVSDVNANVLQSTFQGGSILISGPTAAAVSVGGRVKTAGDNGIVGALVSISGGGLEHTMYARTSSFGYYQFDNIPVGQTYVLTVRSKRFTFANPSILISLQDELTDADFVAE